MQASTTAPVATARPPTDGAAAAADPAPLSVLASDLPADLMTAERSIYEEQAKESGKPEQFWPKIVEGRMKKFIAERALLEQPFVKNPDQTVGDIVTDLVAKLSENISVRRFAKFRVGGSNSGLCGSFNK